MHTHACMHARTPAHTTCIQKQTLAYPSIHPPKHTYTYMIHAYIHTYIHTYVYIHFADMHRPTYIHTYIHTYYVHVHSHPLIHPSTHPPIPYWVRNLTSSTHPTPSGGRVFRWARDHWLVFRVRSNPESILNQITGSYRLGTYCGMVQSDYRGTFEMGCRTGVNVYTLSDTCISDRYMYVCTMYNHVGDAYISEWVFLIWV